MTGTHPRQRPRMDLTGAAAAACSTYLLLTYLLLLSQSPYSPRPSRTFHVSQLAWQGLIVLGWRALRPPRVVFVIGVASLINSLTSGKTWHPQFVWPESVMATDFLYAGTFNVHWLSLLCTYTCARRFGYPQDTTGILRMPRYPQDASGILRIRYPQDTAVSSGYRVLRIPARVLGYGVPRIPPPILGICRCPQDAPRVPGRQTAFTDG